MENNNNTFDVFVVKFAVAFIDFNVETFVTRLMSLMFYFL